MQQNNYISKIDELVHSADEMGNIKLVVKNMDITGDLKELGDKFRQIFKMGGVALIGTIQNNKPVIMCAVTDDLIDKIQAAKIVKEVGHFMGGGGGGKPHIATAGGKNIESLADALEKGKEMIQSLIK